jgi:hypothetical protein
MHQTSNVLVGIKLTIKLFDSHIIENILIESNINIQRYCYWPFVSLPGESSQLTNKLLHQPPWIRSVAGEYLCIANKSRICK